MAFNLSYNGLRITDAIAGALTTSLSAYNSAATGDLVPITFAEYNAIATALNATKTSASDANLNSVVGSVANGILRNSQYNAGQGQNMIAGYTVAARIEVWRPVGTVPAGSVLPAGYQIGYGTTTTSAGIALSNLSTLSVTVGSGSDVCFVVKGASVISPANAFPTIRKPTDSFNSSVAYNPATAPDNGTSYLNGGTNVTQAPSVVSGWNFVCGFQFLQTANKQW